MYRYTAGTQTLNTQPGISRLPSSAVLSSDRRRPFPSLPDLVNTDLTPSLPVLWPFSLSLFLLRRASFTLLDEFMDSISTRIRLIIMVCGASTPIPIAMKAAIALILFAPRLKWVSKNRVTRSPPRPRVFHNLVKTTQHILEDCISKLENVLEGTVMDFDEAQDLSFQMMLSWYENKNEPWDKERYLCISDGFVIRCLDLKRGKSKGYGSNLPLLPEVSTLNLLEMGLPVSMGLCKVGSKVIMVSGQKFPTFKERPVLETPRGLYGRHGFKGSSRETYELSLLPTGLSLSKHCLPLLNKPKFWPIVAKVGSQLHVIESIPGCFYYIPFTIPSHEVRDLDNPHASWRSLAPMRSPIDEVHGFYVTDHLVVGDRIYVKPYGGGSTFLVFKSTSKDWEWHYGEGASIIENAICVKTLMKPGYEEPLYVLIRIGETSNNGEMKIWAAAYLINAKLQVICEQDLPDLFVGLKGHMGFEGLVGQVRLFDVDEDAKTFAAVVRSLRHTDSDGFLMVSTFTVVEVASKPHPPFSVISSQSDIKAKGGTPFSPGEDFVKVIVKDRYAFKERRAEGDVCARLSACFM